MILNTMSNFKQRLTISFIVTFVILGAIYLSFLPYVRPFFALFISGIVGSAVWEYYSLARAKGFQPLGATGIVFAIAYTLATFLSTQVPTAVEIPDIILGLALMVFFLYYFSKGSDPFANLSITVFALIYLAIPLSCMIRINYFFPVDSLQDGRLYLVYLLVVSKMTDTGAYFFGKQFGHYKLAPFISPKKTWEGAIGGLIIAITFSMLFYAATSLWLESATPLTFAQSIWLGALISILAQFGDLAESLLKRDAGVKDSNQLPGLGGSLDIVDSLIFTLPLMYIFLKMHQ